MSAAGSAFESMQSPITLAGRRLRNRVLLRMQRPDAPVVLDQATHIDTMRLPGRGTIVTRAEDAAIQHDHRPDMPTQASGAGRHFAGDAQEIRIPGRPSVHQAQVFLNARSGSLNTVP